MADTTLQLYCALENKNRWPIIKVPVLASGDVCDLRDAIFKLGDCADIENLRLKDLILWKTDQPQPSSKKAIAEWVREHPSQFWTELQPIDRLSVHFPQQPPMTHIHILVECKAGVGISELGKRKRDDPIDVSSALTDAWLKPGFELPDISDLANYLNRPLEEVEKVPLSNVLMKTLIVGGGPAITVCQMSDLEALFRVSEDEQTPHLWYILLIMLSKTPPTDINTENTFISFWDTNIRDILDAIIFPSQSIRDSNVAMSTGLMRPDYSFLIRNICAFRGEEKRPAYDGKHPRLELTEKLTWTYSPAPYILGYYAIGSKLTLVAILPSLEIIDLVTVDLLYRKERLRNAIRMIRLCPVIMALREYVGDRNFAEFHPIHRESTGTIITVGSSNVRKQYTGADRAQRVQHLKNIYDILKDKAVPNVDSLFQYHIDHHYHGSVVYLKPKGVDASPRLAQEVTDAVRCILEALVVMHADPYPIFHRDIRWPNVMQNGTDATKWFLIDWDDAAMSPTRAAKHLHAESHSPHISRDDHTGEVDIWGIGNMIIEAGKFVPNMSAALIAVGQRIVDNIGLTAAQALDSLNSLSIP